jgi:hypothetical protein
MRAYCVGATREWQTPVESDTWLTCLRQMLPNAANPVGMLGPGAVYSW